MRTWTDLTPAPASDGAWIAPRLGRWGTVGSIVGETFDAYAALPHQIQHGTSSDGRVHREDQLDDIASGALRRSLSPDAGGYRCALWEGYGSLGGGSTMVDGEWQRDPDVLAPVVMAAPRLELPHRGYHVFEAGLDDLRALEVAPGSLWRHVPNLFWPISGGWLVGYDVDVHASFVGGSADVVTAVLLNVEGAQPVEPGVMLSTFPGC